ncbi:MAG: map, partial [Pseudomonadota bacterium]
MGLVTNPLELDLMRAACRDAAKVLDFIAPHVKAGVTTGQLDQLCLQYLTQTLKVTSATVGYAPPGYPPFPGAICT